MRAIASRFVDVDPPCSEIPLANRGDVFINGAPAWVIDQFDLDGLVTFAIQSTIVTFNTPDARVLKAKLNISVVDGNPKVARILRYGTPIT